MSARRLSDLTLVTKDNVPASRSPLTNRVALQEIPQFVMITVNDAVSDPSMRSFRPLTEIRNQFGCGIKATFFVTPTNDTNCQLVQALRQGEHEIAGAASTNPTAEEIQRTLGFLSGTCGVPSEELRGFRAPHLDYTFETLQHMFNLRLLYDSSIAPPDNALADFGSNNLWPFTFDGQGYSDLECRCLNDTLPGLWEVPLARIYALNNTVLNPIDFSSENVYEVLNENLRRHYSGNKAPLHIPVTSNWMVNNNFQLKRWIEDTNAAYTDVFFVTVYDVIEYMRRPVSASLYRTSCDHGACFTPLPKDCVFGDFDSASCSCVCRQGFCKDAVGACTVSEGCGDVDGNWSDWDTSAPCCEGFRLESRSCTNPQPEGKGADCVGESLRSVACFPADCPNDGWTEWSAFDECCNGEQTRTRECLASPNINSGRGCIGRAEEVGSCSPDVCVMRYYPDYSKSTCVLLGKPPTGVDSARAYNAYEDCCNDNFSFSLQNCISGSANPPIDGGWSPWSSVGPCCDFERIMTRTCTNPAPAFGGADCEGSDQVVQECTNNDCENGGWSEWSEFGECCNRKQTRTRQCLKTSSDCEGEAEETQTCSEDTCTTFYSPNFNRQVCVRVLDPSQPNGALLTEQYSDPKDCCNEHFSWTINTCLQQVVEPVDGGWTGKWHFDSSLHLFLIGLKLIVCEIQSGGPSPCVAGVR